MTAIGHGVVLDAGEGRRVGVARDTLTFKGASEADHFSVVEYKAAMLPQDSPPDLAAVAALFAKWDTEIVAEVES